MPCHAAIVEKALVLKEGTAIDKALKTMKKQNAEYAAVVDGDNTLIGFISAQIIMKNLLPVSVAMSDGIQLDVKIHAAPGVAKRLNKLRPLNVETLMESKGFPVVYPETPLWEGVNLIVQSGLPLIVAEAETFKYIGIISHQSALAELERLQDSES